MEIAYHFDLFWEVKIQISFSLCSTVVVDFDTQQGNKALPKDGLRAIRDKKTVDVCDDVVVDDKEIIPVDTGRWTAFLANRENKSRLIAYLSTKLETVGSCLQPHQTLLVSCEGNMRKITSASVTSLPYSSKT